jgi:Aerotolerance regulator N-terminal/von Willebrand factor type A domain
MSFLYPAFLIGALAIAIPIVLHLLRREVAPEVPFTAVRLLHRAPVERAERRRLRDLILLAARVAALLLLAAAFARPYVQGAAPAPMRIVAIDRSYSMGAPGVFPRALALARQAIDEAASGEQIVVLAFDDRATVLAAPGGSGEARAALDGLTPGFGATRYGPVFQQAVELAAGATGRVVIVSDLQRTGWEGESSSTLPAGWDLTVVDVLNRDAKDVANDGVLSNVAVTAARVDGDRIVAAIRNRGATARTGRVRAVLDGHQIGAAEYAALPGATVETSIAWRAPEAGTLQVVIDDTEGLPADNAWFVALGGTSPSKVLIVGADEPTVYKAGGRPAALYLSRALSALSGEDVEVVSGARLAGVTADHLSARRGVALLSTRGLERATRERLMTYVTAGGGLFVAAGSDLDPSVLAEMTGWPAFSAIEQSGPLTLAATDLRHPIFRPFGALAANLGQVRFDHVWRVSSEGWSIIARFSNGSPALLERAHGTGRVVLFASDLDRQWNDFPLHPGFVPFAIEALRYVGGDRRQTRDYTVAQAPSGTPPVPGVYRDAGDRPFAVNVDTRESALDRMDIAAFEGMVPRSQQKASQAAEIQARQTESRQSYWQYGLALLIATLVAESVVGRA